MTVYKPKRELFLHERIILWRGDLSDYKHNLKKIKKFGLLVTMVCEGVTGYICNFKMSRVRKRKRKSKLSSLLKPFLHLWHHLYTNNYYNSIKMAQKLLKKQTGFCGALVRHKSVPNSLKNLDLKFNAIKSYRKNNVLIQAWKRKKSILYMISTIHSPNIIASKCHKTRKRMKMPTCVIESKRYTKDMDWTDRDLKYYSILRKTGKWTKKCVLYLINCALFNAYQIFKKESKKNISFEKFLIQVADELLNSATEMDEQQPSKSNVYRDIGYIYTYIYRSLMLIFE